MSNLKIAAVCMHSVPLEIEKNLSRIEDFTREAGDKGAKVICFPELCVTGYTLNNPGTIYSRSSSEDIISKLRDLASAHDMIILAGMIEISDSEKPFISQVVAGPNGLLGIYRKSHLSPPEKEVYQAGQDLDIFSHDNISFGVQLCYEAHFPEISTIMALKGADIIFIPHASPRGTPQEKVQSWLRHLTGRAFDNALFIIAFNQAGKNGKKLIFPGVIVAIDPAGRIITRYDEGAEKMLLVDLDLDELKEIRKHRMRYFLPNRRPELYRQLVK
ncbi:nitrilase-related carbon-nitrogen hydrolase [Thermodesulfobacteriota bacterium]